MTRSLLQPRRSTARVLKPRPARIRVAAEDRVRDAMHTEPTVQPATLSVAEARQLFLDDHLHMILIVESGKLIATIERDDLVAEHAGDAPMATIGTLEGRTTGPEARLRDVAASLGGARRRLAVVDNQGSVVGLLCLKQRGGGFCSDEDVRNRRADPHPQAGAEAA